MTTHVIVLNGGSSSGKTGIARCLQAILPQPWIRMGVDDLLDALPPALMGSGSGVAFGEQGEVTLGEGFREIEAAWMSGVATMARAGARVIVATSSSAAPPPRSASARIWRDSRCSGLACIATPRSQLAASSPAVIG